MSSQSSSLDFSVFLSTVFSFSFNMIKMLSSTSVVFLLRVTAVTHSPVFHCERIGVIVSCVIGRPRQQKALSLGLSCALNVSLRYPFVRVSPKCLHKPIKSFWLQLGAALHFSLPAHSLSLPATFIWHCWQTTELLIVSNVVWKHPVSIVFSSHYQILIITRY